MTLNRMYHCVPRIISGLSQIFGLSSKRDDRRHRDRKQQVRRKGGKKLRDRLNQIGDDAAGCRPRRRSAPRSRSRARSARRRGSSVASPSSTVVATSDSVMPRDHKARELPERRRGENADDRGPWQRRSSRADSAGASADGLGAAGPARQQQAAPQRRERIGDAVDQPRAPHHVEHPRFAAAASRVPARNESGRPRRPAAGTGAGRRSG